MRGEGEGRARPVPAIAEGEADNGGEGQAHIQQVQLDPRGRPPFELPDRFQNTRLGRAVQHDPPAGTAGEPGEQEGVPLDQLEHGPPGGVFEAAPGRQAVRRNLAEVFFERSGEVQIGRQGRDPDRLARIQPARLGPGDGTVGREPGERETGGVVLVIAVEAK